MAFGSTFFRYLGAKATLARGAGFVRAMMVVAVLASMAKLLIDLR